MSLDPRFMIAPSLEMYFVDKDTGLPLVNGIVTFYSDVNRTVLKDIYQLSGSPPNYSYTALPNPSFLSAVGTFQDNSGNDILPYYFPYEGTPDDSDGTVELYYITVESADEVLQFTREGWPNFVANSNGGNSQGLVNLISNGQFSIHSNILANPETGTLAGQITAPVTSLSQGTWQFLRPVGSTATDLVTFPRIGSYVTNPTASPRYFMRVNNTVPGGGDTFKYAVFAFSDVNKFASDTQQYTFAFNAISNSGIVDLSIVAIKSYGTGGDPVLYTILHTFSINNVDTQYSYAFTFGDNSGAYTYIGFSYLTDQGFSIDVTDVMLLSGDLTGSAITYPEIPEYEINANSLAFPSRPDYNSLDLFLPVILGPNGFIYDTSEIGKIYPVAYGQNEIGINELLCDGTQYPTDGISSSGIPYRRLFTKIFDVAFGCPFFGTGTSFLTSSYVSNNSGLGISIITQNTPGIAILPVNGSPSPSWSYTNMSIGFISDAKGRWLGRNTTNFLIACDNVGILLENPSAGTTAYTFGILKNAPLTKGLIEVSVVIPGAGEYFTFATEANKYYVWYMVDGIGVDPAVVGYTGIRVWIGSSFDVYTVADVTASAISGFNQTVVDFNFDFPAQSSYFNLYTTTQQYYVWYNIDGLGTDPQPISKKFGIEVPLTSSSPLTEIVENTLLVINSKYFAVPNLQGYFIRGLDETELVDIASPFRFNNPILSGIAPGTLQYDFVQSHKHTGQLNPPNQYTDQIMGAETGFELRFDLFEPGTLTLTTDYYGENETVPINMALNYVIKY